MSFSLTGSQNLRALLRFFSLLLEKALVAASPA
jgi:hypothetical protein